MWGGRCGDPLPTTLPLCLARAAASHSERGIAVFDGRGRRFGRRSFAQVLALAERGAGRWAGLGVGAGDPVIIALPTSWAWIEAWLGAVLIGALPMAIAPATGFGTACGELERLQILLEQLGARRALTSAGLRQIAQQGGGLAGEAVVGVDRFAGNAPGPFVASQPDPEQTAFLQLTSGSTGQPRSVMIPHRAALANLLAIDDAIEAPHASPAHSGAEALVSWLPLHHDMGLVGCLLLAIATGLDLWLLPPQTFLGRPRLWLDEISRHRSVVAHAPNFAYQLCVERLDASSLEGIELSGWRDAISGGEMIRAETGSDFCSAFAPLGFRQDAFRAAYGLAEASLALSVDRRGRGLRTAPVPASFPASEREGWDSELAAAVCVGEPVLETELLVVGPSGQALGANTVGEVWARGPGLFSGYFNDSAATAEALVDGWLRTGDLGFQVDGELYITGRLKELLIVRGTNFMPHEIEWLAESVAGAGGSRRAGAFSISRGARGEAAILVMEVRDRDPETLAKLERAIRERIARTLALPIADLLFVRRGKLPKTTSGKVKRRHLRCLYLEGQLDRMRFPSTLADVNGEC